jgi:hypothetical protein
MAKTVGIRLSEGDVRILGGGDRRAKEDCIRLVLDSLDEENLVELFAEYCVNERETYDGVESVEDVSVDDDNSGTAVVRVLGSAYFGCRDMISNWEHEANVEFKLLLEDCVIEVTTHPPEGTRGYSED